jgi:ubiquinone biosynthesis monooxygenase Coq7
MDKKEIAEIIRVNHAGEFGAKRIYQGQIAFCKDEKQKKILKEMLEGELEHLEYFEEEIKKRSIRPTAFYPIWNIGGYALGAVTSLMGNKAAMACTEAIESVIEGHYQEQIDNIDDSEEPLKNKITKFREDELSHKQTAIEHDAHNAPFYSFLEKGIKCISKTAIAISKKV